MTAVDPAALAERARAHLASLYRALELDGPSRDLMDGLHNVVEELAANTHDLAAAVVELDRRADDADECWADANTAKVRAEAALERMVVERDAEKARADKAEAKAEAIRDALDAEKARADELQTILDHAHNGRLGKAVASAQRLVGIERYDARADRDKWKARADEAEARADTLDRMVTARDRAFNYLVSTRAVEREHVNRALDAARAALGDTDE